MPDAQANPRPGSHRRSAYPRKRAVQACLACRHRRTKCDNGKPTCSSCGKLGVECVYHEFEKSSFDAASLAILQRLDELETLLKNGRPEPLIRPSLNFATAPITTVGEVSSPDFEWIDAFKIQYANVDAILAWPAFQNSDIDQSPHLASNSTPDDTDVMSRPLLMSDLDVQDAPNLLSKYIDNFHVYNPVLDIPTIEEQIKSTSLNGFGWDAGSCLVLLVFALGTTVGSDVLPPRTSLSGRKTTQFNRADAFFLAAQKRMGLLLSSSGVAETQAFFLAGVYLMTTMRPLDGWKMFARALSSCKTFRPSSDGAPSVMRLHQTIHWACFKSELEVRLELSIVKTSAWDLRYPDLFPNPPECLQSQGESAWYFYLAEIALRRLNNRILISTCKIRQGTDSISDKVASTLEFESQAYDWAKSLPPSLRPVIEDFASVAFPDEENGWLRFILCGHLLDCLELMYWPFVFAAIHGDLGDDRDSHLLAARGLEMCTRRIRTNQAGFYHRHHGTWLMLQSCTRSALMLVAAGRARLDEKLPQDWQTQVREVVNLLEYWRGEVPDVDERLKALKNLM